MPPSRLKEFPPSHWSLLPYARLYLGDVRRCLKQLPARSIHCAITSPPYWGLRDYGICTCTSSGSANPDCSMCEGTGRLISRDAQIGTEPYPDCAILRKAKCGQCFVCNMVDVFGELKRVLRDDGAFWLNIGDCYSSGTSTGLPQGNVIGIPWRVALALQMDGWILRQEVIWSKSDPMPESVTNRCSKSHEYIFMFTKSTDYYYDWLAIARTGLTPASTRTTLNSSSCRQTFGLTGKVPTGGNGIPGKVWYTGDTGNERSVWNISTGNSKTDTHFATFSKELVNPCILASTSEYGCCAVCHRSWERVIVKEHETCKTVGWKKLCTCRTEDVVPCIVLDPFVGSGTTVVAAINHDRHGVGIDVCATYLEEHAIPRIKACIVGGSGVKKKPAVPLSSSRQPKPDMGTVEGI